MKLCECGCGQQTKLASKTSKARGWIKGEPLRFINGHNNILREYPNSKVEKICEICNKTFKVIPYRKDLACYCSVECRYVGTASKNSTPVGTKRIIHGYLFIKIGFNKYQQYHRYLIEKYFEKAIPKGYDVHHINGDKLDNRLENLCVITKSAHMRLHALEKIIKGKSGYHAIR